MTTDADASRSLLAVLADSGFRREAAQMRARAVLRDLGADESGVNWTYVAARLARNAAAVTAGIQLHPSADPEPNEALRYLGDVWDGLDDLSEGVDHLTARLNSAVAYQMAGYQANAAVLAGEVERLLPESIGLGHLVAMLLKKQLVLLRETAPRFLVQPNVSEVETLETHLWEAAAFALAAKGLLAASDFMIAGNVGGLAEASRLLAAAEQGYVQLAAMQEANLARSVRALLPVLEARSVWTHLREHLGGNPVWERYLRLLARGLDRDILHGKSISELWPSQIHAVNEGLFGPRRALVLRMPTSAGKTRIAEMAIVDRLAATEGALCVYVAPYRALAGEVRDKLQTLLSDLGFSVSSLSGAYETDEFELALTQQASVLVLTPEKLDLLDRLSPDVLERVALVLLDESHIVGDLTRGPKYELLISRLRRRLNAARFVSLSAVMSERTLSEFVEWLGGGADDVIQANWRPSIQRVARFHWRGDRGFLAYEPESGDDPLSQFIPGVLEVETLTYVHPRTGRRRRAVFPDRSSKAQVAAALSVRLAEQGPVLIFCASRIFTTAVGKAALDWLEVSKLADRPIPAYLLGTATTSAAVAEEWLGTDHIVTQGLRAGIAMHHGGVPQVVREAIERDVRERRLRIIAATNTLAQGVNMPIRTVVIHSCRRWSQASGSRLLPARDYWNVAGRAGRAGEETEGTIIHLADTLQERRDFRYYLSHRQEVEPLEAALLQYLRELVNDRLADIDLADRLDEDLLALMVEEGVQNGDDIDRVVALLEGSLTAIQAADQQLSLSPLRRVFRVGAERILESVPSAEARQLYATTGLSTASCGDLRNHILERLAPIRALLIDPTVPPFDLARECLGALVALSELQTSHDIGGSQEAVLEQWLNGTATSDLRAEFSEAASSPEEFAAYLEDQFGYRLPWGTSAFIRMAMSLANIEAEELSHTARYLPTMIKFGVNSANAARIMTAGVPSRSLAIQMAANFAAQADEPESLGLLTWLYDLDIADLAEDYGLAAPLLEDVYRSLSGGQPNPRLRYEGPLRDQLPVTVTVRVLDNPSIAAISGGLRIHDAVDLRRDYDSVFDRNAITVRVAAVTLGYLPRSLAQLLAPEMDTGRRFDARVAAVEEPRRAFGITVSQGA